MASDVDFPVVVASLLLLLPLNSTSIPSPFSIEPLEIVAKHWWQPNGATTLF